MPPPSLTALKPRSTPNFVICSPVKASGPENEFEPPSRISVSVTPCSARAGAATITTRRSEEHTSELQSRLHLVCRLLLEKKKNHEYSQFYNVCNLLVLTLQHKCLRFVID